MISYMISWNDHHKSSQFRSFLAPFGPVASRFSTWSFHRILFQICLHMFPRHWHLEESIWSYKQVILKLWTHMLFTKARLVLPLYSILTNSPDLYILKYITEDLDFGHSHFWLFCTSNSRTGQFFHRYLLSKSAS